MILSLFESLVRLGREVIAKTPEPDRATARVRVALQLRLRADRARLRAKSAKRPRARERLENLAKSYDEAALRMHEIDSSGG